MENLRSPKGFFGSINFDSEGVRDTESSASKKTKEVAFVEVILFVYQRTLEQSWKRLITSKQRVQSETEVTDLYACFLDGSTILRVDEDAAN